MCFTLQPSGRTKCPHVDRAMFFVLIRVLHWTYGLFHVRHRHRLHYTSYSTCTLWQRTRKEMRTHPAVFKSSCVLCRAHYATSARHVFLCPSDRCWISFSCMLHSSSLEKHARQLKSNIPARATKMNTGQWGWKHPASLVGFYYICTTVAKGKLRLGVGDMDYHRQYMSFCTIEIPISMGTPYIFWTC